MATETSNSQRCAVRTCIAVVHLDAHRQHDVHPTTLYRLSHLPTVLAVRHVWNDTNSAMHNVRAAEHRIDDSMHTEGTNCTSRWMQNSRNCRDGQSTSTHVLHGRRANGFPVHHVLI
jgi:hypothetical protein